MMLVKVQDTIIEIPTAGYSDRFTVIGKKINGIWQVADSFAFKDKALALVTILDKEPAVITARYVAKTALKVLTSNNIEVKMVKEFNKLFTIQESYKKESAYKQWR